MARILLYTHATVGKTMGGPGIRYWEMAKALSKNHQVTLLSANEVEMQSDQFKVVKQKAGFGEYLKNADVLITMLTPPPVAWFAKKYGVKIIIDAYDPMPFENLEIFKDLPLPARKTKQNEIVDLFNFSFRMADYIICANESQADLRTGMFLSLKRIVPETESASLENKIHVVPFGLSSLPPVRSGEGLKSRLKLKATDKVVLWGGCISNWFDPLSLISAMHIISQKRSDVHLVFMGVKIPDIAPGHELLNMAYEAQKLAKELKLTDKTVHFNQEWVPYEERTGFLLDADVGISTHFNHLETRYSFRTRLLDYIWAQLPIVNTEGDSFSKMIVSKQIGLTVPYQDAESIAKAILHILDNPQVAETTKANLSLLREQFHWDNVVKPIEEIIAMDRVKKPGFKEYQSIIKWIYHDHGVVFLFKLVIKRLLKRLGVPIKA